jgi:pimeloyl-ACP methyl ester carboxylesterase
VPEVLLRSHAPESTPAHPRTVTLDVDGPVHVADYGGTADAPVVVCVHGMANSSTGWRPVAERLTATHRVLAVDLPGHGRSPVAGRPTSVRTYSQVLTEVLAALGTPDVTLVGHSMGAAVAAITAAESPGLVRALVLVAPPLPRDGLSLVNSALLPHVVACLCPELGLRALRRKVDRAGLEAYVRRGLELTCASPDTVTEMGPILVREMIDSFAAGEDPLRSFLGTARSVGLLVAGGRRYRTALAQIRVPTHLVHGAEDRVLCPSGLDTITALHPFWRVEVLPGVGHSPHMEAPARVASIIREFVSRSAAA